MLFTIDAGNTNSVFAVFEKDAALPVFESRINTDTVRMADQYAITMMDILKLRGVDKNSIKGAIISSVVPPATPQIVAAVEDLFKINPLLVGPGIKTGLNIKIDDPSCLGGDLVCAAVAAKELYKSPCIIIDMGTIIKVLALDSGGAFVGGTFSPGLKLSFEVMAEGTASLPLVGADKVENVICTNTADGLRSGVLNGIGCMLDGLLGRFEKELGCEKGSCAVVATGGNAVTIKPYCERDLIVNPHLVSQGLRIIYYKNAAHL